METRNITVAIDGYSSCGKSTMAKALAREVGYVYIDSGAMYRAITLYGMRQGWVNGNGIRGDELEAALARGAVNLRFERNMDTGASEMTLNGENVEREIRGMDVSGKVSGVAALKGVRQYVSATLREMGRDGGIVMDGRDIGTTVFPNAELKIFVTARAEVRAMRRYTELAQKGERGTYEEVLKNVCERDEIDRNRAESPLRKAEDALELDNSDLTREEQMGQLRAWFKERVER